MPTSLIAFSLTLFLICPDLLLIEQDCQLPLLNESVFQNVPLCDTAMATDYPIPLAIEDRAFRGFLMQYEGALDNLDLSGLDSDVVFLETSPPYSPVIIKLVIFIVGTVLLGLRVWLHHHQNRDMHQFP